MSEQVNWVSLCSHALTKLWLISEKKRKPFFPSDQNVQFLAFRSQYVRVSFVQKVLAIIYFVGFVGIPLPKQPLATASVAVLLFSEELNAAFKHFDWWSSVKAVWTPIMAPTWTKQISAKWLQEIASSQSWSQAEPQKQGALPVIILATFIQKSTIQLRETTCRAIKASLCEVMLQRRRCGGETQS